MATKLHPRFLAADPDSPCRECDKVRKTCKYCENCNDCCLCRRDICSNCGGAGLDVAEGSDLFKDLGFRCNCEPCQKCGKVIDRDEGSYLPNDYRPFCTACFPE